MCNQYRKNPWPRLLKSLMVGGLVATSWQPATAMVCYGVADNDGKAGSASADVMVKLYSNGITDKVGSFTGTNHIEAITFDPKGETLYAFNSGDPVDTCGNVAGDGQFGTLDLNTGEFKLINNGFGLANGALGPIEINDVDGLTFDYAQEGVVYGTHRRHGTAANGCSKIPKLDYDLLVQINPHTGTLVKNAFGAGVDYVVITVPGYPDLDNVDDIASDPKDGTLYIVANTGDGIQSALAKLPRGAGDAPSGEAMFIGYNDGLDDMESLDFDKHAVNGNFMLYGTTGYKAGGESNQLYQINKDTGSVSLLGKLLPPAGEPQTDFEAVACQPEADCLMYAVHDEGQYDTQIVEIDPYANSGIGAVRPLGPLYPARDIEGLAIDEATGKLYGTSGGDLECVKEQAKDKDGNFLFTKQGLAKMVCTHDAAGKVVYLMPQGALYEIDRQSGALRLIGAPDFTGFYEVSSLTYNPIDGTIWGWASGGVEGKPAASKSGPITIDPITGKGTLVKEFPFLNPTIQGVAFSNDGTKLYGVRVNNTTEPYGSQIWEYDVATQALLLKCHPGVVGLEAEALEMQPNGLLLLASHNKDNMGIIALDPNSCKVEASRSFKSLSYYDIESIEWPAKECQYRSWLSAGSGDIVIVTKYRIVPGDVVAAVRLALGNAEGLMVESQGGKITLYIGNQQFIVQPALEGTPRSGNRSARSADCPITDAQLSDDFSQLTFSDCNGNTQNWALNPVSFNPDALLAALNQFGQAEISDNGVVTLTLANGGKITGKVSSQVTAPSVGAGGSIASVTENTATLTPLADIDGNGNVDYTVTYSTGHTQVLLIESIQ